MKKNQDCEQRRSSARNLSRMSRKRRTGKHMMLKVRDMEDGYVEIETIGPLTEADEQRMKQCKKIPSLEEALAKIEVMKKKSSQAYKEVYQETQDAKQAK